MVNFNKSTLIIPVLAFIATILLLLLVPFLQGAPNIVFVPVAFTVFSVFFSKAGKLPIRNRGDINAIVLVMLILSSAFVLLGTLAEGSFSIYSVLLLLVYGFVPHMLLSVIFRVDKKK
jgi:hypothetical protein